MGYYHRFIPKFVQVAHPLHELTLGENAGKKKAAIKWESRCQQAFDVLKTLSTMAPILAYADFTNHLSFILVLVALVWELSSTKLERMAPKQ